MAGRPAVTVIGPDGAVATLVVGALDQHTAHVSGVHLGEGDFGRAGPIDVRSVQQRTLSARLASQGLGQQQTSFDNVGACTEGGRDGQAQRSCGFRVDNEVKARGSLER